MRRASSERERGHPRESGAVSGLRVLHAAVGGPPEWRPSKSFSEIHSRRRFVFAIMPSMGATGQAPDPRAFSGRGWEPERTYHTPRADASRSTSSKSSNGGNRGNVAGAPSVSQASAAHAWRSHDSSYKGHFIAAPASDVRAQLPGNEQRSLRATYKEGLALGATLPGPPTLGEGSAQHGFDPQRGIYGHPATKAFSTRKEPPAPPMPPRDSSLPLLMNSRVLAGGRPPLVPEHHRPGYQSPDRALVGDEERTALAMALKRMGQ